MREALYYEKLDDGRVRCTLCPVGCVMADGKLGKCFRGKNVGGTFYSINYGHLASVAIDPIEKKPLYHFHPGAEILSTGPNGCNMNCRFCQNWEISQSRIATQEMTPEELAQLSGRHGSIGIAYTYTEPLVWFEYLMDCGRLVKAAGRVNVLVTNGYINEAPLRELLPLIDAMNVDLKAMDAEYYRKVCRGGLEPVLRTIRLAKESGVHVELTNLIVPSVNDSDEQLDRLISWVAELDENTPMHFSAYFPRYKLDLPATPIDTLKRIHETAKKRLKYVYVGNAYIPGAGDTYCPACGNRLISRRGYSTKISGLRGNACKRCGTRISHGLHGLSTEGDGEV